MVCERKKEEAERELAAATEALEGLGVEVDELRQELDELRQEKEEQQEEMQVCVTQKIVSSPDLLCLHLLHAYSMHCVHV